MSDLPPPLLTPNRAREIARVLLGAAVRLEQLGASAEAKYLAECSATWRQRADTLLKYAPEQTP